MAPSLVFSTSGDIVGQIADKHNQPYSRTLFWIRCKLNFSLLRSSIFDRGTYSLSQRSKNRLKDEEHDEQINT